MMTRQQVLNLYDQLNMAHGITKRFIKAIPVDKLDWAPIEGMRTARQLIEHIYAQGSAKAEAIHRGSLSLEELLAHNDAPKTGNHFELILWCEDKFEDMQEKVRHTTEAQMEAPVKAFFGELPGAVLLSITYDEWWHHRGQLSVYLRLMGIPVPNIYGFFEKEAVT